MSIENNKMQVDIENLFKQNVIDLSAIKELYRKLKEVEEKISQIKYIDHTLVKKLKKEYEKLKKIILDENIQANLTIEIETINAKLSYDIETINAKLTDDIKTINLKLTDDIEPIIAKLTDDIKTINSELDTKANTTDFNFIRKDGNGTKVLLDNGLYADFTGGQVSSVTLYSELGYKTDGAISQKDVSNAILNNNLGEKEYDIDNFEYGYILNSEGVKTVTDINWGVSEFIECKDKIFKIKTITKNDNPCFCFYSSNDESSFIKSIYAQDDIIVLDNPMKSFDSLVSIPAGANYIRVVCNKYNDSVINNYRVFKYYNPIKYEINEFKNNTFELLKSDRKKEITDTDILLKNKGFRLQKDGSILENSGWWVVSDFIKIEIGSIVTGYCAINSPCIAIYDENKEFVMSYNPDTTEGDIMKKTIDISEYVGGYVRLQSNTTFNSIAKFKSDATLKDDINSINKEIEEGIYNKLPYQSGNIYFSVKINKEFPTNGTSQSCEDTETLVEIPCVLKLPATYTKNGTPTKLIMTCHGAGGVISNNSISSAGGDECIINGGFAWFDVNGSYDNSEHMSGIRSLEAYKKAYDYIIKNYNIDPIILVHGRSMGGLTALNFTCHFSSIVSACACVYPVTDLYNQAWLRPWSSTCKKNMAIEYNFNDKTGNTFEEDKVIGFNPIKNNTFTISDKSYTNFPVPLKIWHGLADTTVRIDESRKLVSAIKNYGGRASIREIEGMTHTLSDWLWNETFIWLKRYS